MKKNHPDRSGQDEQCKNITEAYQTIVQYKLNLNNNEKTLIPLEYTEFKFKKFTSKLDHCKTLELKDIEIKKRSMFDKVFDYFFDLNSDDESDDESDDSD